MSNALMLEEMKKAMGAHGAWKLRLRTAISVGKSDADPSQVKCDNLCEFGKWLYGQSLDAETKRGMPYHVVRRLHAEFHECAGRVLDLALRGQKSEALTLLDGEYTQRSEKLVLALTKWRREISLGILPERAR
jgi:Chemoreceptor zinc-binding domain